MQMNKSHTKNIILVESKNYSGMLGKQHCIKEDSPG